jgi:hypothetical protein
MKERQSESRGAAKESESLTVEGLTVEGLTIEER